MTDQTHLLELADKLQQAGQQEKARQLLQEVLRAAPTLEDAWWRYINTFSQREDRLRALMLFAQVMPDNPRLARLIKKLAAPQDAPREALHAGQRDAPQPALQVAPPPIAPTDTSPHRILPAPPSAASEKVEPVAAEPELIAAPPRVQENPPDYNDATRKRANTWVIFLSLICIGMCVVVFSLRAAYSELKQQHDDLTRENIALELNTEGMERQISSLQNGYNSLQGGYDSLYSEHTELINNYNYLVETYNILDQQAVKPPYIYIHQRQIDMAFFQTGGELIRWTIPFESLEAAIESGYETRADLDWVSLRTDDGDILWARDYTLFVEPDSFRSVIADLYYAAPDADTFIRQVWTIVTQMAIWTEEIGDVPRYPLETLLAGGGDCEDLSILFASMVAAAPVDWVVELVYVDTDNLVDPQKIDHLIVHVNTGERGYLIETTNNQIMEPYTNGVVGWYRNVR